VKCQAPPISEQTNSGVCLHRRSHTKVWAEVSQPRDCGRARPNAWCGYKLHGYLVLLRVFDRRDGCMRICSRLSNDSPRLEEQMFGGPSSASMRSSTDCVPIIWRTSQDRVRCSIIVDDEVLRLSPADHMRSVGHCGEPYRDRIQVSKFVSVCKDLDSFTGIGRHCAE
jgi:hypothetical protein